VPDPAVFTVPLLGFVAILGMLLGDIGEQDPALALALPCLLEFVGHLLLALALAPLALVGFGCLGVASSSSSS